MLVHPKQLVPGCLITKDVMGKTIYPIIPKNTIINDKHVLVLTKFLIENVEVSDRLNTGIPFSPKELEKEDAYKKENPIDSNDGHSSYSFYDYYINAVEGYKKLFLNWQSGATLDINQVRKLIFPLFDQIDQVGLNLYLLHQYSSKKDYFFHHCISIALISAFLAKKRNFKKEWIQVGLAGLLADSGMAKINRHLFSIERTLTLPEYEEIKKHPTYSYRLVEKVPSLSTGVKLAILQHHERLDGSGYPLGVEKNKIHPYARILAIVDTYHAMTSERIYQKRQSPFKVIEEMIQDQFAKFDHEILQTFIENLTSFSIGTRVQLSNGKKGEIVFIEPNLPTRPMIKLEDNSQIISLKANRNLHIEELLS
ncbi:HD domain-containing protein [Aquibacillus halophilus]|uniref:HD domain-containing protein n=1 Tax=Aquibacillus halophilus TaxID=930132 RepID=A0A6A8DFD1_9BACI|nr:HD-GYP domain-containing protein [Aquibacillus halophilus]MRH44415.1 HD domain-containing protein [Aquibacillus halophilus]